MFRGISNSTFHLMTESKHFEHNFMDSVQYAFKAIVCLKIKILSHIGDTEYKRNRQGIRKN